MLLIKRAPGESITVGDEIGIRVISIRGDRVMLDIAAPTSAAVVRRDKSPSEQSVYVGDDVELLMAGICGQHVRVGINAPKSMFVSRGGTSVAFPSGDHVRNTVMELRAPLDPRYGNGTRP